MKTDKEGVFGVRLECLLERDNEGGGCHKVPEFFKQVGGGWVVGGWWVGGWWVVGERGGLDL